MGILIRRASSAQAVGSLDTPGGTSTSSSPSWYLDRSGSANIGGASAEFTIEAWLRCAAGSNTGGSITEGTGYVNDATDGPIWLDSDDSTNGSCFILGLAAGIPYFGVNCSGGTATRIATTDIRDGDWHHVVWQRRSSDGLIEIFVDGTLEENFDGPNGAVSYPGGGSQTDGRHTWGKEKLNTTLGYDGETSEVRIVAARVYTSGSFTPPSSPLTAIANTVALWHMADSGSPLTDSSDQANNGTLQGTPNPTWSSADPFGGS